MNTSKLLLHPARLRILQYIRLHGNISTTELLDVLRDIPRATVYHHVKLLEENGMIEVTAEKRVRGSIEKTYGIKDGKLAIQKGSLTALSAAFHMELMEEMNAYLESEEQDCEKDRVLFQTGLFYLSDGDYDVLLENIASLLKPYISRMPDKSLPLRKLSLISSPPVPPDSSDTPEERNEHEVS